MWTTRTGLQHGVAVLTAAVLVATALPFPASAAAAKDKAAETRATETRAVQARAAADASTDFSGARRARRGNDAAALAMFGLFAGTIATIAINEQRRKRERDYWRYRYGHYHAPYAYHQGFGHPHRRYWGPVHPYYR